MADGTRADSPDDKKAVFRRLVEIYALGDVDALDELIVPDYVGHTSAGDRNLDAFRHSIRHFHNLFAYRPDSFIVEDQVVEGDKVVTRMTADVTDRATGAPVTMMGINIAIIRAGKLIEEWNVWEAVQPGEPRLTSLSS